MFLEHRLDLLSPLLHGTIAAVNASSSASASSSHAGPPRLNLNRGKNAGAHEVGEAQILRFRSGVSTHAAGNRMHVHVDKPGTRWVALLSLGESSTFLLDHAPQCKRCWTGGGKGTAGAKWKDWHSVDCATCREVTLRSGDCLLFFAAPEAGVAHGTLATHKGTAPEGLPSWCYGGRVSCQFRQTEIRQNFAECGAYD